MDDCMKLMNNYDVVETLSERIASLKRDVMKYDGHLGSIDVEQHPISQEIRSILQILLDMKLVTVDGDVKLIGVLEIDFFLNIINDVTNDLRYQPNFIFSDGVCKDIAVSLMLFYPATQITTRLGSEKLMVNCTSPNDFHTEIIHAYMTSDIGWKVAVGIWETYLEYGKRYGVFESSDEARSFDFDATLYDFYLYFATEIDKFDVIEDSDDIYAEEFDILPNHFDESYPLGIDKNFYIVKRIIHEYFELNIFDTVFRINFNHKEIEINDPINFIELFERTASAKEFESVFRKFKEYLVEIEMFDSEVLITNNFTFIPLTQTFVDHLLILFIEHNLFGPSAFTGDGFFTVKSKHTGTEVDYDAVKNALIDKFC